MGSSIGVEGSVLTATMGGFVKLKVGSKIHFAFLTNRHVVAPKTADEKEPTAAKKEAASNTAIMGYEYSEDISGSDAKILPPVFFDASPSMPPKPKAE